MSNDNLMSASECAALIGVTRQTVLQWARTRDIPHIRPMGEGKNRPVRFNRNDVLAWLESHKVQTND